MDITSDNVRLIYNNLQDDKSRNIFEKRLMYSLTSEYRFIQDIVEMSPFAVEFKNNLKNAPGDKILFGSGRLGRTMAFLAPECWKGIADNDSSKWGKKLNGVPIISPQDAIDNKTDVYVAICNDQKSALAAILAQLKSMGVDMGKIHLIGNLHSNMNAGQYFDLPELYHVDDEAFVDAGAYDGGTSKAFAAWSKGKYSHIYAFESNPGNLDLCKNGLNGISQCKTTLFPYGVWKERSVLHFSVDNQAMSKVDDRGRLSIQVTSIDEELSQRHVTFIKMDIEGAELEALKGARHIISEQHPKLAICVYHKPEDIIEIPKYILTLNPNYKLYIRHYSPFEDETVLYAI